MHWSCSHPNLEVESGVSMSIASKNSKRFNLIFEIIGIN